MIVRFSEAAYGYPGPVSRPVVDQLSFEVAAGHVISILGRNGTGKSTILALAAGLVEPTRGSVDSPADRKVRVPIVFQDYRASLFPRLNAFDNIALPLVLLGRSWREAREATARIVAEAGLRFDLHRPPASLSGGQAQMVSLLRALALDSPLVLFDEPSSALDIFASIDLAIVTSRLLRSRGSAAMYVSHSIDEAILVADEVLVLSGTPGRIAGRLATLLPYPRKRSLLNMPAFGEARNKLLELISRNPKETTHGPEPTIRKVSHSRGRGVDRSAA